jgi:hypothetical protein
MLDKDDILALKEIFQPQFEHLGSQLSDVKESIARLTSDTGVEHNRRRDDVKDLYNKDREKTEMINKVEGRVISLEATVKDIISDNEKRVESNRFTISQWLVVAGVVVTAGIFVVDKLMTILWKAGVK